MNFIPYIGSILAAARPVIVASIQFGPGTTVRLVILAFLLVNFVVNYGLYPRLMGRCHPAAKPEFSSGARVVRALVRTVRTAP